MCVCVQHSAEAVFLGYCHTNFLSMRQPKMCPWDIWRTLIFVLSKDVESVSCVGNSYRTPKITLFFTGISIVITTVLIVILDF